MPQENLDPMRALDGLLSNPALLNQIQNIARQFSASPGHESPRDAPPPPSPSSSPLHSQPPSPPHSSHSTQPPVQTCDAVIDTSVKPPYDVPPAREEKLGCDIPPPLYSGTSHNPGSFCAQSMPQELPLKFPMHGKLLRMRDEELVLLQALRPFLNEMQRGKLDRALRLLRLWHMAQGLKDYL